MFSILTTHERAATPKVYDDIAKASGGQVFNMQSGQIDDILVAISKYLEEDYVQLQSRHYAAGEKSKTQVKVDSSFKELVVTVNGKNPQVSIVNEKNEKMKPKTQIIRDKFNFLTLDADESYYELLATANSAYSLIVGGNSELKIYFGFSVNVPTRLSDTSSQPLKDA